MARRSSKNRQNRGGGRSAAGTGSGSGSGSAVKKSTSGAPEAGDSAESREKAAGAAPDAATDQGPGSTTRSRRDEERAAERSRARNRRAEQTEEEAAAILEAGGDDAALICPYCGDVQPDGERCRTCRGGFDDRSKVTINRHLGPWYVRGGPSPHLPGCRYETMVERIRRGKVTAHSIVRGPSTNQLWMVAKDTPGLAHRLGWCHSCGSQVSPDEHQCPTCDAVFMNWPNRDSLGVSSRARARVATREAALSGSHAAINPASVDTSSIDVSSMDASVDMSSVDHAPDAGHTAASAQAVQAQMQHARAAEAAVAAAAHAIVPAASVRVVGARHSPADFASYVDPSDVLAEERERQAVATGWLTVMFGALILAAIGAVFWLLNTGDPGAGAGNDAERTEIINAIRGNGGSDGGNGVGNGVNRGGTSGVVTPPPVGPRPVDPTSVGPDTGDPEVRPATSTPDTSPDITPAVASTGGDDAAPLTVDPGETTPGTPNADSSAGNGEGTSTNVDDESSATPDNTPPVIPVPTGDSADQTPDDSTPENDGAAVPAESPDPSEVEIGIESDGTGRNDSGDPVIPAVGAVRERALEDARLRIERFEQTGGNRQLDAFDRINAWRSALDELMALRRDAVMELDGESFTDRRARHLRGVDQVVLDAFLAGKLDDVESLELPSLESYLTDDERAREAEERQQR